MAKEPYYGECFECRKAFEKGDPYTKLVIEGLVYNFCSMDHLLAQRTVEIAGGHMDWDEEENE